MAGTPRALQTCPRLLLRASRQLSTSLPLPALASITTNNTPAHHFGQRRSYAKPRAPRPAPSPSEVYNLDAITPEAFAVAVGMTQGSFTRLTPAEYRQIAVRFAEAIKKGSSPWNVVLTGDKAVTANTLHEVACIIGHIPTKNATAFAVAMWASASEMGSRPATLSLARQLIGAGSWGRASQLSRVESRFQQLVSEGTDANVLTLQGELQYRQGSFAPSVRTLQRALELGGPGFEWMPKCRVCLGKAYLKLNKHAEASEALEPLSGADAEVVDFELGPMLRLFDKTQAEQHLFNGAVHGRPELFQHLSEIAMEREAEATDERSKTDQQRWALEWSRLGDPSAPF